ncbi:hypothetical protein H8959_001882 [Pygathrix nigripes]
MEDHRDEDFMKSKGAFTGEGQKPSSTDPQRLSTISPVQPAENEDKANSSILIVKSETTTNIQIRLADALTRAHGKVCMTSCPRSWYPDGATQYEQLKSAVTALQLPSQKALAEEQSFPWHVLGPVCPEEMA